MTHLLPHNVLKNPTAFVLSYIRVKVTEESIFWIPLSPKYCVTFQRLAQHTEHEVTVPDVDAPCSRGFRSSLVVWPQNHMDIIMVSESVQNTPRDISQSPNRSPRNSIPSTYILGQKITAHSMGRAVSAAARRTLGLSGSLLWGCPGLCRVYRSNPGLHPLPHASSTIPSADN